MENRKLGFYIKRLSNAYDSFKNADLKEFDLTAQQFETIMFLHKNSDKTINQKDIEEYFKITAATASGILKRLELKGYIKRVVSPNDSRFKEIILTPIGEELRNNIRARMDCNDKALINGFSEDEYETLIGYLKRIINNVKEQ